MMKNSLWLALGAAGLVMFGAPREAEACGGTFCDAGPQAMPVDQTGEVVLFVMGEETTEAHIKIQYDPDAEAEEFAWLVPITEIPQFAVGSDVLFDNVLAGTVPSYGFSTQFDSCGDGDDDDDDDGAGGDDDDDDDDDGGPNIVLSETVGAFDIVVLEGGTSEEVVAWLDANEYQQDPASIPIIEEYLAENYLFAAFKLTNGAETDEIHPIALTFPNNEACVPLRLTRIAAVEDMDIRTFFLADDRVVPQTYKHVLVNPLKLDWPSLGSNYKELITLAVDADGADGRAFVTEYAGPSNAVSTAGLYDPAWSSTPFAMLPVAEVVDELASQGLMSCFDDGGTDSFGDTGTLTGGVEGGSECQYNHPLLRGLLNQWLPVPDGIGEIEFYGCLSCYEGLIDPMVWDGAAFASALEERIIAPALHASNLLATWPYLTRMYTTISPGEMTADPFFHTNPDLDDVDLRNEIASRRFLCNGANLWTLPNGDEVYVPSGSGWPQFDDEMPWEEEVAEIADAGAPLVLVDNAETIDAQLSEYNCQYNHPTPEACGNEPESETSGADADGGNDGDTDGPLDGGTDGGQDGGQDGGDGGGGGCGCTTSPSDGGFAFMFSALGLLFARRRRTFGA